MKAHLPVPRHTLTAFIQLNPARCQACWQCVAACPTATLGRIEFLHHRHAHVDQAGRCKGCRKCVRICLHDAISPVEQVLS